MVKYIFVTGGVVSGLGKGITAASLGRLLKQRGFRVTNQKFDPYVNVDPGTMSPYQHGEVYVTDDGAETDLDLGHYERFIDENLNSDSNITTGKVYSTVIRKERNGEFLGKTVQVVPHITNEIKDAVYRASRRDEGLDFIITEIGGTVGDIESLPFIEAIRQVPYDVGRENVLYIHVTLVPYIASSGELKTKPTQHSVKELQNIGIAPDIVVCRTEHPLGEDNRAKIALFCNVSKDAVIENRDAPILYAVPLMLEEEGLADVVLKKLGIAPVAPDLTEWTKLVDRILTLPQDHSVRIGLVGKYVELHDAYISVAEALRSAGWHNGVNMDIEWIQAEDVTDDNAEAMLGGCDGILVPGGFGDRGIAGKIAAARYARTHDVPYLGICLGMQVAVIEFARNVLGLAGANSTEFAPHTPYPVIHILPDKADLEDMGGTLRLGAYPCVLEEGSLAARVYGTAAISERHRHRYEFNNDFRDACEKAGMRLCGKSPDGRLVEMIEIPQNKFFIAVQFHPEFKSRPNRAHPLFASFVKASVDRKYKG